jgi:hypothetical protein
LFLAGRKAKPTLVPHLAGKPKSVETSLDAAGTSARATSAIQVNRRNGSATVKVRRGELKPNGTG